MDALDMIIAICKVTNEALDKAEVELEQALEILGGN